MISGLILGVMVGSYRGSQIFHGRVRGEAMKRLAVQVMWI